MIASVWLTSDRSVLSCSCLFTTADARRLRECASPECGLLFLDLSRPGRRRWCSSNACGGKTRAAAYRQRRQPPAETR